MIPFGWDKSGQNHKGLGASSLGKTSCLLCYHPVSINLNRKSSPGEAESRRKMVKALCEYQKLTFAIPDYCSELKYPFCVDCKRQLEGMSREWEALKVTFAGIERQVVDGEVKRFRCANSGMVSELEKEKAVLLRDMLLEGYRVKLLQSQRRPYPAVSNMMVGSDASRSSSSSSLIPEQSASLTSDSSWIEMEMDESDEAEESVDILVWDDEQPTLGDSETSSNIAISNIRTVANEKEEVCLQVKKEMIAGNGTENQSVSGDHEVFQLAPGTKRRRWYEGIEIFRIVGSGPDVANHQLQCSLCNFTVVDKTIRRAGKKTTGFKRMKDHIHVEHLGRGFEQTSEKVEVQLNNKSFEHDCDICGRKVKGPLCNLKRHKFLHKNDAERQAAVDAGERGDYIMSRLANKQKSTRKPLVFQSSRIRGRKQIYKCFACGKIFDQESEFKEHAKYHEVERASSMDARKSTATHPSVRRSAVKHKLAN